MAGGKANNANGQPLVTATAKATPATAATQSYFNLLVYYSIAGIAVYYFGIWAYRIRMLAIEEYGPIIHEFDPYFNWRATEYLYFNGWNRFVKWFDYKVWYPLGRPVGTTIYPGMQVTAVFIKKQLLGKRMSLNDICCYMPAWFGVIASVLTGMIAYECSIPQNSRETIFSMLLDLVRTKKPDNNIKITRENRKSAAIEIGISAMAIMAVIPAHLMRSVGGGYDNESVAVTAMTLTFWLWCRSLRADDSKSYIFGAFCGVAYFYMVASWGGYVFVLNLVGAHAAALVAMGRFTDKVYLSYSLFYSIGTFLAIRVPVVGLSPLKSFEQLAPCAVFLGYQVLQICQVMIRRRNLKGFKAWSLRIQAFIIAGILAALSIYFLLPLGYFGPLSARVRGLFVKHTRTGNPLVDSVAEHQPANQRAYFQYLHYIQYVAPIGFVTVLLHLGDAPSFLLLYAVITYFFSSKMVRLILLLAPIASALSGAFIGRLMVWSCNQLIPWVLGQQQTAAPVVIHTTSATGTSETKKKDSSKKKKKEQAVAIDATTVDASSFNTLSHALSIAKNSHAAHICKRIMAVFFLLSILFVSRVFKDYCWMMASALNNPSIIMKARTSTGEVVKVDDYREAYFWLKDNTPKDSRILAWWDYGYQITGIANRTTLADGNTWNHEHIALLGRILTGTEKEGYEMARHLADYALIWTGGGGDDLAKSPHLARIANSIFRKMCPGDPTCRSFGFIDKYGTPSTMMANSFLYKLHSHKLKPGVEADPTKFREVYRTKYGKVRIYKILNVSKESKAWVSDPRNRKCDVPGSWYCPGQYPPALEPFLREKRDFGQLEDFNRKAVDDEYQKAYHENLADPTKAGRVAREREAKMRMQQKQKLEQKKKKVVEDDDEDDDEVESASNQQMTEPELIQLFKTWRESSAEIEDQIDDAYERFRDTEETTLMWKVVTSDAMNDLLHWLAHDPIVAFVRSSDGRGPMWWAYESNNMDIVDLLKKLGLSDRDKDKYGKRPIDLVIKKKRRS